MFKKILIGIAFVGLIAALVWGGVNRTLAKSGSSPDNYGGKNLENSSDVGENQTRRQGQGGYSSRNLDFDGIDNGGPINEAGLHDENQLTHEGDPSNGQGRFGNNGGRGFGRGSRESLSDAEIEALHMALDDEYHALATYLSVIETFGEIEPFTNIAQSEQRHINALVNQFKKSGIPVPENPWLDSVMAFDSVEQACQVGAEAEIANADLYKSLLEMTENPRLIRVFTNLSRASTESHLREFQACQ